MHTVFFPLVWFVQIWQLFCQASNPAQNIFLTNIMNLQGSYGIKITTSFEEKLG